jgi:hypothetical protein
MRGPIGFSAVHVGHMAHNTAAEAKQALRHLITDQVSGTCDFPDDQRERLLNRIQSRYGQSLCAVLIYGSYLRGKRDTLLDFYVLLDTYDSVHGTWQGLLARALPPNVYQIHLGSPPEEIRAKYALMTLDRFENTMRKDFHSYFWARFAQPCGILYCKDKASENRVIDAICQASLTFAKRVAPRLPETFDSKQLWAEGLSLTYRCEFRSEPPGHAGKLFEYWPDYYRSVTLVLSGLNPGFIAGGSPDRFSNACSPQARRWSAVSWWLRRAQGKVLSTLRILKAAVTFDGALDYLLWKIKRHSGVYIEPSGLQRKYPVIFAWPLLFQLWRRGAFR